MISYLGVTIDELVQSFESSFAFTDEREERKLEEAVYFDEGDEDEEDDVAVEAAEAEDDEELDDEEVTDVMVDDNGLLHCNGETVPFAAENAIEFLTDYIIADDIDDAWLTLDQARGALLALKILLPTLEEIPEVESAYSFSITRDTETGLPSFVKMHAISAEGAEESFTHTAALYEGVVKDSTILVDMFDKAGLPAEDSEVLIDVVSESIFALADEQCGIVIDAGAFREAIAQLTADPSRLADDTSTETSH